MTYRDIMQFVVAEYERDSRAPAPLHILAQANQALAVISKRAKPIVMDFSNVSAAPDSTTDIVVVANTDYQQWTLPTRLMETINVHYDDILLANTSFQGLNYEDIYWKSREPATPTQYIQNGRTLILDYPLESSPADGTLVVTGYAALPEFVANQSEQTDNPLDYIPTGHQLDIAYYIIAMLPATSEEGAARRQQYREMWDIALAELVGEMAAKRGQEFMF